jgi:hypothetical protein
MFSDLSNLLTAAASEAKTTEKGLDAEFLKTADAQIRRLTTAPKVDHALR